MNNIMKLAQEYAVRYRVNRAVDEARAALEAAVTEQAAEIEHWKTEAMTGSNAQMLREQVAELQAKLSAMESVEPVLRLAGIDNYGPKLAWYKHWTEFPAGTELYAAPKVAQPPEWMPVSKESMDTAELPDWFRSEEPMWVATTSGVYVGTYEWRQGRNPHCFTTLDGGSFSFPQVTHIKQFVKPAAPAIGGQQP